MDGMANSSESTFSNGEEYALLSFNAISIFSTIAVGLTLNIIAVISLAHSGCVRQRTIPLFIMTVLIWCDFIALVVYVARRVFQTGLKSLGIDFYCNVFGSTNFFFSLFSALMAMLLACERYYAFVAPFKYRHYFTHRKTAQASFALAVFALIVSILPILGLGSYGPSSLGEDLSFCKLFWKPGEPPLYTFQFCIYIVSASIPMTVVVICNFGLTLELVRMRRKIIALTQGQNVSRGREIKFVWTVMVITVVFLACWMPWVVTLAICKLGITSSSDVVVNSTRLLLLNHAVDPLVFLLSRYARRVYRLFKRSLREEVSARTTVGLTLVIPSNRPREGITPQPCTRISSETMDQNNKGTTEHPFSKIPSDRVLNRASYYGGWTTLGLNTTQGEGFNYSCPIAAHV